MKCMALCGFPSIKCELKIRDSLLFLQLNMNIRYMAVQHPTPSVKTQGQKPYAISIEPKP